MAIILMALQVAAAEGETEPSERTRVPTSSPTKAQILDVIQFGAKGDGATDDTAAIQAAIDSAAALTEAGNPAAPVVFVPAGTYLTGMLKISAFGGWLTGAGSRASFLKRKDGTNAPLLDVGGDTPGPNNLRISSLALIGNGPGQTSDAPVLRFRRVDRSTLDHLYIEQGKSHGILASNSPLSINKVQIYGSGGGSGDCIRIRSVQSLELSDSWLNNCDGYGAYVELDNSDIEQTGDYVQRPSDMHVVIRDNHFENNLRGSIGIKDAWNTQIHGNLIDTQGGGIPGIDVLGMAQNNYFTGNVFRMDESTTTPTASVGVTPTIRFASTTANNVTSGNTLVRGDATDTNNADGLELLVLDHGRNYALEAQNFRVRSFGYGSGGHPLVGWQSEATTNYVLYSEDLTNGAWMRSDPESVVSSIGNDDAAGNPISNGGTATSIQYNSGVIGVHTLTQTVSGLSMASGRLITFSAWMHLIGWTTSSVGYDVHLRILDEGNTVLADNVFLPASKWQRFAVSFMPSTSYSTVKVQIYHQVRNAGLTYRFWGAQLNDGDLAPYIPTTSVRTKTLPGLVASQASFPGAIRQNGFLFGGPSGLLTSTAQCAANEVPHGNDADAPLCGQVKLTADVAGVLPASNGGTNSAFFEVSGPTGLRAYTFPDADAVIARTDASNTFKGAQTFAGHVVSFGGAAPTAGTCGTSAVIGPNSQDAAGSIIVGTTPLARCTVNFGVAYSNAPHCVCSVNSGGRMCGGSATTTVLTLMENTPTAGDVLTWICTGH